MKTLAAITVCLALTGSTCLGAELLVTPVPLEEKKFDVAKDAAVPVDWSLPCGPAVLPCIK